MNTILILTTFLYVLILNIQCRPNMQIERQKRSVFDIIPVARNVATSSTALQYLPNIATGVSCGCRNTGDLCVLDVMGRCRRVWGEGGRRRRRGGPIHYRRKRHQRMKKIRRKYKKWLKQNSRE